VIEVGLGIGDGLFAGCQRQLLFSDFADKSRDRSSVL